MSESSEQSKVPDAGKGVEMLPSWLINFFGKMKQEIKKEVLEELLGVTQREVAGTKTPGPPDLEGSPVHFNESDASQFTVIHDGIFCDNCDQLIHGIRYKCGNCSDFDLCQECESLPNVHNRSHIFLKIRYPASLKLYQKQKWQELMNPHSTNKAYKMNSRSHQGKKLYEATFLCDETVPDSTVLPPSTKFVKTWRVVNSGTRVWTHLTKLQLIQGSADLVPVSEQADVPHLKPGEQGTVDVHFVSPSSPGVYRSHWNFRHKGRPFGHIVWCHITVKSPENAATPSDGASEAAASGTPKAADKMMDNKQSEVSCIEKVLTAVKEEHEKGNMIPRKLNVSSHTATPNNTPFDLTPPKSPDHRVWTLKEIEEAVTNISPETLKEIEETFTHTSSESSKQAVYGDDLCSFISLSNSSESDSDTEFVVIPMPKCFDLSESFVSNHLPGLVQANPDTIQANPDTVQAKPNKVQAMFNIIQTNPKRIQNLSDGAAIFEDAVSSAGPREDHKKRLLELLMSAGKPSAPSTTVSQETGVPEGEQSTVPAGDSSSGVSVISSGASSPSLGEAAAPSVREVNVQCPDEGMESVVEIVVESAEVAENLEGSVQEEVEGNSATFPKFPVVTFEQVPVISPQVQSQEERTIQVLPESLVNGTLSAAASVYNAAKAVMNTIQQPRTIDRGYVVSNGNADNCSPMGQLIEMGFFNRQLNEQLLKKHNNDIASVVAELVNTNDNDWYESRHSIPSPPTFD